MATGPRYAVRFRRRREGKTNYQKRLKLLKSGMPRLIVRRSNKFITVQITNYDVAGDKTLFTVNSAKLKGFGWNHSYKNTPAAYLVGLLAGKLAKAKVPSAITDIGMHTAAKGAKVFAAVKGAADAGLKVQFDASMIQADRIMGKHILAHLKKDIPKDFEAVKAKILK